MTIDIPLEVSKLKPIISKWAEANPLIKRAYVFGSRARGDHRPDSDLDVAVEINKLLEDENTLVTWIFSAKELRTSLAELIALRLDLQWLNGDETPIILKGVEESSILIFDKTDRQT